MPSSASSTGAVDIISSVYKQLVSENVTNEISPYVDFPNAKITTNYRQADSPISAVLTVTAPSIKLDLTTGFDEPIIEGSVRFTFGGRTYIDTGGQLFFDVSSSTGAGSVGGTINYVTGEVVITDYITGANNAIVLESLSTSLSQPSVGNMNFRIKEAPIKPTSLQIRVTPVDGGGELVATSDSAGIITGTDITGKIDYDAGWVSLEFGTYVNPVGNETQDWYNVANIIDVNSDPNFGLILQPREVLPETMFYNATAQTFLPLDASILGLDPVRLPQDGRIAVFSTGDVVVILNDQEDIVATPTVTGTAVQLLNILDNSPRGRIAKLEIRDSVGGLIDSAKYSVDLDVGTYTWIDLTGISVPVTIKSRIEDMALLTDVQITGTLTLSQPLTHKYPPTNTLVSNAVLFGDIFSHTTIPFDQQVWTNTYSDILIGNDVSVAQYNNINFPITLDNASSIEERWVLIFTSSTTVNVVGEHIGQVLNSVLITNDIAPINLNTGQPYFTIPFSGWGGGWSTGNVLRFNTISASKPVWVIESVGQGDATDPDFNFSVELRGDINTP